MASSLKPEIARLVIRMQAPKLGDLANRVRTEFGRIILETDERCSFAASRALEQRVYIIYIIGRKLVKIGRRLNASSKPVFIPRLSVLSEFPR